MHGRISAEERAELKSELRKELLTEITEHGSYEDLVDSVEEETEAGLSYGELRDMSEADINRLWPDVQKVLEAGPEADPFINQAPEHEQQRRATGQQFNERPGAEPLSIESIRRMDPAEVQRRLPEINEFLSRGSAS